MPPPRFELGSKPRKGFMLGLYTTGAPKTSELFYLVYNSNKSNPESKQVFNSLSKTNKTAILNLMFNN